MESSITDELNITDGGADGEEEFFMNVDQADSREPLPDTEQIDADPQVRDHLSTGNSKLSKRVAAQFGRSMTKAEEILVAPCGIIHARETQYFAEAISNVAVR